MPKTAKEGPPLTAEQQALCVQWRPLAIRIAMRMRRQRRIFRRMTSEDAEGAAMLGLIRAVQLHDPARGTLGTLMQWTIRSTMEEEGRVHAAAASVPLAAIRNRIDQRRARTWEACLPWLAGRSQVEGWERRLAGRVEPDPLDATDEERLVAIKQAMRRIPPRDRQVIRWHCEGLTFAEIGRRLGVSREFARQMWKRSIERIRREVAC